MVANPEVWMAEALRLAARGRYSTHPNPRVGCVIVSNGTAIGRGWHLRAGEPHAEVHALREAGASARGAEVFVTLEPCAHHGRTPPCAAALVDAGVRKVWVAMQDPDPRVAGRGISWLRDAGIEVVVGLMREPAERLNRGFVSRMTRGRPFVTLKLAASCDGRTAMASGESRWVTSEPARADVHRLRAEAGAVLTGVATVLADDPQLNCRESGIGNRESLVRQPDRIVLDTHARTPTTARVWADGARRLWMTQKRPVQVPDGVTVVETAPAADGSLDLHDALARLGTLEVNEVLAECGPRVAGSLLRRACVDEVVLYLAPALLGHEARPFAYLPGLQTLDQRLRFVWRDVRQVGADLRLTLVPERSA